MYRTAPPACGGCQIPMAPLDYESWRIWRCGQCQSSWLSLADFSDLMARFQPKRAGDDVLIHNDGSPRRPCPECRETMDIAWVEFLQLDCCERHGLWCDRGELERALAGEVDGRLEGQRPDKDPRNAMGLVLLLT